MKCNEIHIVCIAFLLYVFFLEVSKVKLKIKKIKKKREATKITDNSWLPVLRFPLGLHLIMNEKKVKNMRKKQTIEI